MNEVYGFLLVVNIMCTSNFFDSQFVFPFATENTSIIRCGKSPSPHIIKQQLSYQSEVQKIFLRGKKFRLEFPFDLRRLPTRITAC